MGGRPSFKSRLRFNLFYIGGRGAYGFLPTGFILPFKDVDATTEPAYSPISKSRWEGCGSITDYGIYIKKNNEQHDKDISKKRLETRHLTLFVNNLTV